MYAETGHRIRAELTELLNQHRIQQRLGGPARYQPMPRTPEERQAYGELIRRFRQSALVWCHEAAIAVAPSAVSAIAPTIANPFNKNARRHESLDVLNRALETSIHASSARLPTMHELTTAHDIGLVEHWRQLARAAVLSEQDFDAGLGHGRLDAAQSRVLIGDIAAVTRALVVLDQRYSGTPGWERLHRGTHLGWAALSCALEASLDPPDYSVDLAGWRPSVKVLRGPAKPGLLGVLQAEHNLLVRMNASPSAMNLRLVVDSQRLLSADLAGLAATIDPDLAETWARRSETYRAIQHELRNVGGNIGRGGLAVAEGANAVSRLEKILPGDELDPRVLHAFSQLFDRVDGRVADALQTGISKQWYFLRVRTLKDVGSSGTKLARPIDRYMPLAEAEHSRLTALVNEQLRPAPEPKLVSQRAVRSRAELHQALITGPDRSGGLAI